MCLSMILPFLLLSFNHVVIYHIYSSNLSERRNGVTLLDVTCDVHSFEILSVPAHVI